MHLRNLLLVKETLQNRIRNEKTLDKEEEEARRRFEDSQ